MGARRLLARTLRALGGAVAVVAIAGGGTAVAASQFVTIAGLAFSPSTVTVSVGETVTWTNNDTQIHTATADDGSWNAGNIAGGGGIGAVVFSVAGSFPYHCEVHPTMTGTVTVAAAAAPSESVAGATMRPTDTAPISGPGRDMGLSLLPTLAIAALAMVVAVSVMRRPPNSMIPRVVAAEAPADVVVTIPRSRVALPADGRRRGDGTLAPIVIGGGVALIVAIALIGRRLTSRR